MKIDATDLGELQKALNDLASALTVLWTTFVTFELYFTITVGSVTHRDLFLENPIRLPLLNVDLPLLGFFSIGPIVLIIIHFYVLQQALALALKADCYNALLYETIQSEESREYIRERLNSFLILQMLAGPIRQRRGFDGLASKLIVWLTIVMAPVIILIQCEVAFLPLHNQSILWLQRIVIMIDLAAVWYFLSRIRNLRMTIGGTHMTGFAMGSFASLCVLIFSLCISTFPGEVINDDLPDLRVFPASWFPHHWSKGNWISLHDLLFTGVVDEISGKPTSLFSNRLVVTGQSFVDPDKIGKMDISLSFRGRDLRSAVLFGVDLRKADWGRFWMMPILPTPGSMARDFTARRIGRNALLY
jgi:hypothetical protein